MLIQRGKLFLTDNRSQRARILHLCIGSEELVCDGRVIGSGVALADAVLHQTGQRRQNRDRRIDTALLQTSVQNDLTFGDIACQVRDRVGDIVIRHGQDRELRHAALNAFNDACTLIERCEIGIEIAREALSARDFAL